MSDIAIQVEGIGKKYKIGKKKSGELRETFSNFISYLRTTTKIQQPTTNEFWALKDISFEVKQGEAVGIIGRNGAGKSTLLKVLSRITKPTTGRFEIHGRVSSLLEVGTGFHPELTGRENIYLNGTILGMRRAEVKFKFDEIIAFSGVEDFIDTTVKHYSSGMKVRLAFSVAAHLEPEILIIDEVLAVGDADFQKKCLSKMEDVTGQGRTVLFVSHNMGAVRSLCNSGMLIDKGIIKSRGFIDDTINSYLLGDFKIKSEWANDRPEGLIDFDKVFCEVIGDQPDLFLKLRFSVISKKEHRSAFVAFDISDELNFPLFQIIPDSNPFIDVSHTNQEFETTTKIPSLIPGKYFISAWIGPHNTETYSWRKKIVSIEILQSPISRSYPHSRNNGFIVLSSDVNQIKKG